MQFVCFCSLSEVAKELDKVIILYYGVNDHGKGLVDAMSGFGVKTPLRWAIVMEDFMFNTALELTCLKKIFENDKNKLYQYIPSELLKQMRQEKGNGVTIKGCRRSLMISFFPCSKILIKRHLCWMTLMIWYQNRLA